MSRVVRAVPAPRAAASSADARRALRRLERIAGGYDAETAAEKVALVEALAPARLARAGDVERLHEVLCRLRAYPDGRRVLRAVERALAGFAERADLRRHRAALEGTGIAGTSIRFSFYWSTALWLLERRGAPVDVDWARFENHARLEDVLELLFPYVETLAFENVSLSARAWIGALKGEDETDGAFLIRRFRALRAPGAVREALYDALEVPLRVEPGPGCPTRTHARHRPSPVVYGPPASTPRPRAPLDRITRIRPALREASPREGRALIDLAREAMTTRQRDLHAFMHADPADTFLVDFPCGLQCAGMGLLPASRYVLEGLYVFLMLKNGVPIGYTQARTLFRSAEINFNVFDTFRGLESSHLYTSVLAMMRTLFGARAFVVNTQQIGEDNAEALRSGAYWFYYKHGFRSHDPELRALARRERALKARDPRHRSSRAVLARLAGADMHLHLGAARGEVITAIPLDEIGFRVSGYLARRFGSRREAGTRECAREAAALLGLGALRGFSPDEREAWARWSPLVLALPGVARWGPAAKRALVDVVRAKGGRHERDFVLRFDRHAPLRRAVLRLAGMR